MTEFRRDQYPDEFDAAVLIRRMVGDDTKPEDKKRAIAHYREIQITASTEERLWSPQKTMLHHIEGMDKFNQLEGMIEEIEKKLK